MAKTIAEDFDANWKLNPVTGCHEWQRALSHGYGHFMLNGVLIKAHRYAYERIHGPIETGKVVCHTCDNPLCVNEAHLWAGSHSDNSKDAFDKKRLSPPVLSGAQHGMALLDEAKVREIRKAVANGAGLTATGREYGVSAQLIYAIKVRRIWKHVP